MMRNTTSESLVYGEPPLVTSVPFCNQIAMGTENGAEKEFPHIAHIKVKAKPNGLKNYRSTITCVGSLISDRFVITSSHCSDFYDIDEVIIELGRVRLDSVNPNMRRFKGIDFKVKAGIALIKLDQKVVFSEYIIPACIFPDESVNATFLISGWVEDIFTANPVLKKWKIQNDLVEFGTRKLLIDEAAIVNHRQVGKNTQTIFILLKYKSYYF